MELKNHKGVLMKSIVFLFVVVLLAGCVFQSQILMNNQAQGVHCPFMNRDSCVEYYKQMGYVEIEKVGMVGVMTAEDCSVTKVFKDSPADRAGIKVGDVIVSVNGKAVKNNRELSIASFGLAGDPVELKVRRGKEGFTFKIVRGQRTKIAGTE